MQNFDFLISPILLKITPIGLAIALMF